MHLYLTPDDISLHYFSTFFIGILFHEDVAMHTKGEKLSTNNETPVLIPYKEHVSVAYYAQELRGAKAKFF